MTGSIELDGLVARPAATRGPATIAEHVGIPPRSPLPPPRQAVAAVLVCDRLRVVAESLAGYLNAAPGLAAPGVATTPAEFSALLEAQRPDLVVLDSALAQGETAADGEGLVAAVRRSHPETRVLMIGPTREAGAVARALREGALGWLPVDASAPQLVEAAFGVLRGEYRIAPGLLAAALGVASSTDTPAAGGGNGPDGGAPAHDPAARVTPHGARRGPRSGTRAGDAGRAGLLLARLSERERLVLSCLVGGMHRREIAAKLGIAETTARTHISRILSKLDAHSMIEAAALGRRAGLPGIEP